LASWSLWYGYTLAFEALNALGHCNVELIPPWLFAICPPLKFLLYTSAYHSLHHSKVSCNYCLFMPLYDYVYGTAHPASDALHVSAWRFEQRTADVVVLVHGNDVLSVLSHLPGWGSVEPFTSRAMRTLLYPAAAVVAGALRFVGGGPCFAVTQHTLGKLTVHVRCIPAWRALGHFHSQSARRRNATYVRNAVAQAQADGARVVALSGLTRALLAEEEQEEAHDDDDVRELASTVRVVTGDTLAAAAVLHQLPEETSAVVMVDSPHTTITTDEVMRLTVLALLARGVRVLALSLNSDPSSSDSSSSRPTSHDEVRLDHRVERCDARDVALGVHRHATHWLVAAGVASPVLHAARLLASEGTVLVMCGHAMTPGTRAVTCTLALTQAVFGLGLGLGLGLLVGV